MNAEIICIGSELILGETVNTNAAFISKELAKIGINCFFHTCVGDNINKIKATLDVANFRSDIIITTGGLGPTADDITIESIAEFYNEKLVLNPEAEQDLKNYFVKRNRTMPKTNFKQVYFPKSAKLMKNPVGTAPGMILEKNNKIILSFPGVPDEMYEMWENQAKPFLLKFSEGILLTKHLRFFNIPEALLAEKVLDLLDKKNPTVAPLVSHGEATLRIGAKAKTEPEAQKLITQTENDILQRVGEYFYGYSDTLIEDIIGKLLIEKSLSVAVAESCTGGLVSSRLTDVSGSSKYIYQNVITYSNNAKITTLKVKKETLETFGAVSEETAKEMATGIKVFSNSDIGLSTTGIAGPTGGSNEKPVGLVYIGITNGLNTEVHEIQTPSHLDRKEIKFRSSQKALILLKMFIEKYF